MSKQYTNLNKGLILKYFWNGAKHYKKSFFIVVFCTILASILDIYIPLQYLKLWNVLEKNDFNLANQAYNVLFFIIFLTFSRWFFRRVTGGFFLTYFEANTIAKLKEQAFSYLIGHSHNFFASNFTGSLTQKINRYVNSFEKMTDRLVVDGLPLLVRGLGTIIAIYTLLPKYSFILLIFSIVFIITTFLYIKFKLKFDLIQADKDSRTTGAISDSISNNSSVQLFSGHNYERETVGKIIKEQRKATLTNWNYWEGLTLISSSYYFIMEFIVIYLLIGDWKIGLVTLPIIVVLQSYLIRLIENLWSFGAIVRTFYQGFADANEMVSILSTPYEILDNGDKKLQQVKGEIEFKNVSYFYNNNDNNLLQNFSLKINQGEKVALVGISGAGKTTFVKLLMRFFDIKDGSITIDGIDIRDIKEENLRENIGFVPQEPVLFHRTLMENIRYGRREALDEEVFRASSLAHCDQFIESLPEKYNTYVGERGIKLSGGERQRVAIARAILKNAPILVLDEATSSLDSQSEYLIQEALKKLIENKTAIVIAHRLSTIKQMDRIIVIDNGKIIEDGKHEELIKKENSLYKKLWEKQVSSFEID